jgi:hypothetical protein
LSDASAYKSKEIFMPEKRTLERAARDKRQGKSASTQAGEFVREQIHHIRQGRHGARSAKQAIAIGLSQARRSGVDLPAPKKGVSSKTRRSAEQAYDAGGQGRRIASHRKSAKRAHATETALKREGRSAASRESLSRQARSAATRRSSSQRSAAARQAARTKGAAARSAAARKAARTRAAHAHARA